MTQARSLTRIYNRGHDLQLVCSVPHKLPLHHRLRSRVLASLGDVRYVPWGRRRCPVRSSTSAQEYVVMTRSAVASYEIAFWLQYDVKRRYCGRPSRIHDRTTLSNLVPRLSFSRSSPLPPQGHRWMRRMNYRHRRHGMPVTPAPSRPAQQPCAARRPSDPLNARFVQLSSSTWRWSIVGGIASVLLRDSAASRQGGAFLSWIFACMRLALATHTHEPTAGKNYGE
ncbi:uncharacterized protein K452DRAFT_100386 [Aplosporella prunicola CBS 121167]|uniref:Uncharacterized protein n=1 Tax=Aplosporella prunicola CBS 121167 TaxID=1176127 RepID=A0A6A6B2Q0_9PEZI|nr:uncharacterized protein K452DRAFT_100386 [Aplosporella prunicola CBS 121167]KAF2137653.1 hypothetical protein K452DRAFT_100386 [Aplosporella prunicola CBS 121167]